MSQAQLIEQWSQHWRGQNPRYRVAHASFGVDFGAEGDDRIKRPTRKVAIATMAKALRASAAKQGKSINDTLLRLMLGQKLGAEGAMPGLMGTTFAGTNNSGAAQVPGGRGGESWANLKRLLHGWGAFAHKDTNPPGPAGGPYIGWYFIAPTVQDSADQWLTGYAGTRAVLAHNPQTPEDYARIMRDSGYYTGFTNDREKEISNYASAVRRGMPSIEDINGPSNDPNAFSVDPSQFRSIRDRKITEDLFNAAKHGKQGSAWAFLLPDSWADMVKSNGVVWLGKPVTEAFHAQAQVTTTIVDTLMAHPVETVMGALGLAGLAAVLWPKHGESK